jgi:GT2 family glycosyltransferase
MIFDLTGLDENRPLAVQPAQGTSFRRGSVICAEEIALMEQEIAEHAIPPPSRGSPWRPRGRLAVACRPGGIRLNGCEPVGNPAPFAPWWKALPIVGARRFWRTRLRDTAATVLEAARSGRILLVGEHAATSTLAEGLVRCGKETRQTAGPDGSSRSYQARERPAPGSLFAALHSVSGDLSAFGAVVFIGNHDFVEEHAAVLDCTDAPPVILARLQQSGLIRTSVSLQNLAPGSLPRISIVTVSYNQGPYLEACINSVLNQGYPNLEYIIIDGGSTDGSVEIIERYRAAFAHVAIEPDKGQSDALNKGFARTTGEMLNWLCSDDMLAPGALRHVGEAYARHRSDLVAGGCKRLHESPGCGADRMSFIRRLLWSATTRSYLPVSSAIDHSHYSALPLGRTVGLDPYDILQFMRSWQDGNYFFQPEVFFSRRIWEASGAYLKPHLEYAMDYDMWLRMALAGATARAIPQLIGVSRVHAAQKTRADRVYLHQLRILMEEYAEMFEHLEAAARNAAIPPSSTDQLRKSCSSD